MAKIHVDAFCAILYGADPAFTDALPHHRILVAGHADAITGHWIRFHSHLANV